TARLARSPFAMNRFESAATISEPFRTRASPTGASPTVTSASNAERGFARNAAAENPSSASLALAVTQTTLPFADLVTRTGLQPAGTRATTDVAGSDSARATLMTSSVPTLERKFRASLVE